MRAWHAMLILLTWAPACAAFCALVHRHPGVTVDKRFLCARSTRMAAMDQIDWQDGVVLSNQNVADVSGSQMLRIQAADKESARSYKPGHVLALRIPNVAVETPAPGKHGDGCTSPYTVAACDARKGVLSIVFRIVEDGRMSKKLGGLKRNSPILFGGQFKTPIRDGIAEDADHIVGISTGVGLGPLIGFAQEELAATGRRVTLFAGFRDLRDIVMQDEIDDLSAAFPGRFAFVPCISSLRDERYPMPAGFEGMRGRVSEATPLVLDGDALRSGGTHVHLIGNGGMVHLMREALSQLGVSAEKMTEEIYFNHKATPAAADVARVTASLAAPAASARELRWSGAET